MDHAFYREKQVQGCGRKKKEALIKEDFGKLRELTSTSSANLTNDINSQASDETKNKGIDEANIKPPELVEQKNVRRKN